MLDRETIYQVAVLAGSVALFVAAAGVVSVTFSTNGRITPTGGIALVGAILLFILFLAAAGVWLERQDWDGGGA